MSAVVEGAFPAISRNEKQSSIAITEGRVRSGLTMRPKAKSVGRKSLRKSSSIPKAQKERVAKDCSCGQEEKVLLLVGCTQHGKSSLIRSILDYGGYHVEADNINIGAFGNKSTTKDTSSFSAVMSIDKHYLRDEDGNEVDLSKPKAKDGEVWTDSKGEIHKLIGVEEPDNLYDLEPKSTASGRHIHIRLIDTPGLDDSDNAQDREGQSRPQKIMDVSQMRTVDEQHKFTVLKAVANENKIHAVCFVLSVESTLGNAVQDLLREYLEIFNMSRLNASYYFAHTKINAEKMFEIKARSRPEVVRKTFGLSEHQAKHYLINNLPLEDDEIEIHFARASIAQLLSDLSHEKGQTTTRLRYPKSGAHQAMDHDLNQSFDVQKRTWQRSISKLQENISELESSKNPLEVKEKAQKRNWQDLRGRVASLDTEELVEVGYQYLSERGHLFSTARLYFNVSAKCTVRDYKMDRNSTSFWEAIDNNVIGTRSCWARLKGDSWGDAINGSITLFGWKKEDSAAELARLKREEDEAESDYKATKARLYSINTDIEAAKTKIEAFRSKIQDLEKDRLILKLDHIPLEKIKLNASYFGSPSVLCYAAGFEVTGKLPRSLLYTTKTPPFNEFAEAYERKKADFASRLDISEKTLAAIQADYKRKERTMSTLKQLKSTATDDIKALETTISRRIPWKPWSSTSPISATELAEVSRHLETLQSSLSPLIDRANTVISENLASKLPHLSQRLSQLQSAVCETSEALQLSKTKQDKWVKLRNDHKASLEAAKATRDILSSLECELGIGAFTVLRKGIEEAAPESLTAWDELFEAFRAAWACDPRKWDNVVTGSFSQEGARGEMGSCTMA